MTANGLSPSMGENLANDGESSAAPPPHAALSLITAAAQPVRSLRAAAVAALRASSPTPHLDAELLLAHALGWSRARLVAELDHTPSAPCTATFCRLVERRAALEPVAYLVGQREFYGLTFEVDARVLIPRPETELLVECALATITARFNDTTPPGQPFLVADVGTGSGAIALALASRALATHIYATDVSAEALEVAAANCARHHMDIEGNECITLLHGDLFSPLPTPVDLIVSNPPYTILSEIDEGVRRHEPRLALDGGTDGLHIYRRLIAEAPRWLRKGGTLLVEIGAAQGDAVLAMARAAFPAASPTLHHDLAGHARVVVVQT